MKPPTVVEEPRELEKLVERLERSPHIAIDTESNSFHAYFERICLIQISTEDEDYIVDPLTLADIEPLGSILANPGIEKIFHAASNDISGLRRDFHFKVENLFDTSIACKMLGYVQLGLASILEQHFGVHLDKKLQRHNWSNRPLTQEQLSYARLDTHYLIGLRHILAEALQAGDHWEGALEVFSKASLHEIQEKVFNPDGFHRIHGAESLDPVGRSILRALYLYRDKEARRRNRAPFRILSNEALVRLAVQQPATPKELATVKGLSRFYRNGRAAVEIMKAIGETRERALARKAAESAHGETDPGPARKEEAPGAR
jgi:ribonuclease D